MYLAMGLTVKSKLEGRNLMRHQFKQEQKGKVRQQMRLKNEMTVEVRQQRKRMSIEIRQLKRAAKFILTKIEMLSRK